MDEAKAHAVRREESDPYIKDKSWTCAHCSVHYLAPVVRKGSNVHCKAAYVSFFPLSSPVLLLLPCPCACISRLRFFFRLYEGTKSVAQSKTLTTSTSSRRNELRADQLYSVGLRTTYVFVVLIRVLRACGHLGLWCPICVMRECLFVCVSGCWVLVCDAYRHKVDASLVRRDWMQVPTISRSTVAPSL